MMFVSTSVIVFAIAIAAVLMAANWLIWGLNNPRDLRSASTVTPLGGRELVELALRRLVAGHEAVLPRAAASADSHQASAGHTDDPGFKHVA